MPLDLDTVAAGSPVLAFGLPGGWEWMVILLVALLIFGARLPQVAKSMGEAMREFKKGVRDVAKDADPRDELEDRGSSSAEKPRRTIERPQTPLGPDGEDARVAHGEGQPVERSGS